MAKRPRMIQQCDAMQCGVASLAMVCDIFGQHYSIDDISRLCYVTREGVSMLGISRAAKRVGLKTFTIKADIERLRHCRFPALLHWNNNHFVVLYKMSRSGSRFFIADPAKGYLKLSEKELQKQVPTSN